MDNTPKHIQRIASAELLVITRFENGGFSISESGPYQRGGEQIAAYSNGHHLVEDLRLALTLAPVGSDSLNAEEAMLRAETAEKESWIARTLGPIYQPTTGTRPEGVQPPPPTDD